MNSRGSIFAITVLLAAMMAVSASAHAYSFYWSKVEVKTTSWQTCMNFANTTVSQLNLSHIQRSNLAVTGSRNGADATITCIGTGGSSHAMAVVMVVGDSDQPVRQLRDDLVARITGIQCIDSPC